jgi:hypothetical protein
MDDQEKTIICLARSKAFVAHPESVIRWCSLCGQEVWISAGGLAMFENDRAHVMLVCTECAPGVVSVDKNPQWGAIDPQGNETRLSRAQAERVIEVLNEGEP